ncbi:MAG: bifunctional 3-deoxy-7-phosphoheptulonate synthase/chorismate mutase type II [Prevotellaceae bacterium]|nr:bifunctional 3-deoxy-7-phosphoheptulonate synthase/chorismate mutase type II [Prevotellaceae bacterium]
MEVMHNLPVIEKKIVIAGPCAAETEAQVMETAAALSKLGVGMFRAGVWKPRTKPDCFEGLGEVALKWLQRVESELNMTVMTEVATVEHVELALKYGICNLWIGARTTANPFAVQAIADTLSVAKNDGKKIRLLVKNPMNPDLEEWIGAIERFRKAGITDITTVHRGFSSYEKSQYRNEPMWKLPMDFRRRMPEVPLICDPSHIAGRADLIESISQQALDLGFDGLMIECHSCPAKALSDANQQLTPMDFGEMLSHLVVKDNKSQLGEIDILRREIDSIDDELVSIIARRMQVSRTIGKYKREHNITVFQKDRYEQIRNRLKALATERGIDENCIIAVFEAIHDQSVKSQL